MTVVEGYELALVRYDNIENVCEHCDTVVTSGQIYIEARHGKRVFALGYEPMLVCCDEDVDAVRVFSSPEETKEVLAEVIAVIHETRSIRDLPFFELTPEVERVN